MILTHRELCIKAGKYLKNQGTVPFVRCRYTFVELERIGECPDAIGFSGTCSQLIEVKVSRGDFLSDKKKFWRIHPEFGLGSHRSYLCPEGMIKVEELPENWGLLYADSKGKITLIKHPERQECSNEQEMDLLLNILRREGVKPKVYSYKKYKSDSESELNCNDINTNNNTVQGYYIRFGLPPEDERSCVYDGDAGIVRTEDGVSVYDFILQDGSYKIVLPCINIGALHTLEALTHYNKTEAYLVKGDLVGTGTDGEPLIRNVQVVSKLQVVELHDPKPTKKLDRRNTQLVLLDSPSSDSSDLN